MSRVDVRDTAPSTILVDLAPVAEQNREAYRHMYVAIREIADEDISDERVAETLWAAIDSLDVEVDDV